MSGVILDSSRIRRLVVLPGLMGLGLGLLVALPAAGSEPPPLLNYQGVLRDASEAPLDGDHDMVFRFWSHETAGDEILVDTHDTLGGHPVTVSGGLFNAVLGGGVVSDGSGPGGFLTLKHVFRDYGDVWLEVEVDGEILAPRVQVLSAGYAVNADHLDGLDSTRLLRSDTSDQFTFGTLTIAGGTALQVDGDLQMNGSVSKATTDLVTNLNADLLDGLDSSAFAAASHGHAGSDITGPVGEASNADTLDGFDSGYFLNTSSTAQNKAGSLTVEETGVPEYAVTGVGLQGGGHFEDADDSGVAYLGAGDFGVSGRGNEAGGVFRDAGATGYAYVGIADDGIRSYGNNSGGLFVDLDQSGQAWVAFEDRGIDARGNFAGGYFADLDSSAYVFVASGDRGIEAYGSEMGGFFVDVDGSGFAHAGKGDRGIAALGNEMGGRFRDFDSTGEAYVGYGDRGIEAFGSETGGYFHDLDESGYAYAGHGHYGIEAGGSTAGGLFEETDGSGLAYIADGDRGVWGYGTVAGGYFKDSDNSGYAYIGNEEFGVKGFGDSAGGYFLDTDSSSYAYLGYSHFGVAGYGRVGGLFECLDGSAIARIAQDDDGIGAYGNNMGGRFLDLDSTGLAYVGYGDFGIYAVGSSAGAHFEDSDSSGYAFVGNGDFGIKGRGNAAGGFFEDLDSSGSAYVGYGSYKIQGTGSVSFVQNHPDDVSKVIVYHAPEASEVAVYTRGRARLENGMAHISLDETFRWVANPDLGLTAHLTPRGTREILAVESLSTSELVVIGSAGSDAEFDYMVWGLRIGFEEVSVVQEKTRQAYIPKMDDHRDRYARSPELRRFNALERFRAMATEMRGTDSAALDLSATEALRAAIQEYDPEIHGPLGERSEVPEAELERRAVDEALSPPAAVTPEGDTGQAAAPVLALTDRAGPESAGDDGIESSEQVLPAGATLFPVTEAVEPGDLLALDPERPGSLRRAASLADPSVIGIAAGESIDVEGALEAPVLGAGFASLKADASYGAVLAGDLLTSSPTPGHAMVAIEAPAGTVIGKALETLESGVGLIRVLVIPR